MKPSAMTNCARPARGDPLSPRLLRHSPTDSRWVRDWDPHAQPSEPILFPKLTDLFCRHPLPKLFHRPEVVHLGTVPSPSPGRHAATRSRRGSSSSSPPTADGFGTGTPVPSPQSQSFSRSYGSILPTSLAYIVPSTRGCSPWRPDAVMSTTGRGRHSVLRIFKGRRERTGHHATCGALPAAGPYLRLSRFQGGQAVKQKR
ncbi:hypothetical protein CQW23_34707 [Capsicum baccatum]|uniref:Protein TAR1 n=1 Tax=Capsicum baccatum TaxID=33114 RepID=A0A2G2UY67_CAPBA|nr:hypothetical protein CQW23_34707 [Capsicum baccatum]